MDGRCVGLFIFEKWSYTGCRCGLIQSPNFFGCIEDLQGSHPGLMKFRPCSLLRPIRSASAC
jgi:hypothetical protein